MGLSVKLQVFEGPLDLLLHLIDKNKVNIYDIPIVEITEQYLDYIRTMEQQDLNVVSEFLVMAATLIDIKCKMLLPREVNEEGEEQDPRAELVEQLLQHKMYKYMSYELRDRQLEASHALYKPATVPEEVLAYSEPVNVEQLLADLTLAQMQEIFQSLLKRQENKIDPERSRFGKIEKEELSLADKLADLSVFFGSHRRCSFRQLLGRQKGRLEIVVSFLAILEMMKRGMVFVRQSEVFEDIDIEVLDGFSADVLANMDI